MKKQFIKRRQQPQRKQEDSIMPYANAGDILNEEGDRLANMLI